MGNNFAISTDSIIQNLILDKGSFPKDQSNVDQPPRSQRPSNSKATEITALFARRGLAPISKLDSKGVSDDDQKLAEEIEALLEELEQHPGGTGDLEKEIQDLKDQIKKSLKDAGASDEDINSIMDQIGKLGDIQGSDRTAAIKDILDRVSQLTGKSVDELATGLKSSLNEDIKNNKRIEQDLELAKELRGLLDELEKHPGGAEARQDSIKRFLKEHGVSDDDIANIMDQIGSLSSQSDPEAMAKLLMQIADLTGVSEKDLMNTVRDRINRDIFNNEGIEAAAEKTRKAMLDTADSESENSKAKQNTDNVKHINQLIRAAFLTPEDKEKLGCLDMKTLTGNPYSSAIAERRREESSPLGQGGVPPELLPGIMIAAVQSDLHNINRQVANFVKDLKPLLTKISPQVAQAFDEVQKIFQQGSDNEMDGKGLGNSQKPQGQQPPVPFDPTQTSTFREFLLRLESEQNTEKQTDAEIIVSTQLSKDQAAAQKDAVQKNEDAIRQREKDAHMSGIQKFFHKIASFFVDLSSMVTGAFKIALGAATGNSKLQGAGAAQMASGAVGMIKDLAELAMGNNPEARAKLEDTFNKILAVVQDALTMVVGALDIALGDEAQGAIMLTSGAVGLAVDIVSDILDAVDMDPKLRDKIKTGLMLVKDLVGIIAAVGSFCSVFKKGGGQFGKKAGQAAEKPSPRLSKVSNILDRSKNITDSLLGVAGGGIDIAAAVAQKDAAKTKRDAKLSQIELNTITKALVDSFKSFNAEYKAMQSFLSGFIAALNISFETAKGGRH